VRKREVVSTGISELDEILGGGFEKGSVVLVAGHPGAGKTTFAAQFLYQGLKSGEAGLYMSFAERKYEFFSHMEGLGMNFKKYEKQGLFVFIPALTTASEESLRSVMGVMTDSLAEKDIRRLVIDPVTAPLQILPPNKARAFLHSSLMRPLKSLGITTLLVAELPYGVNTIGYGFEEFLADAVIVLGVEEARGLPRRTLELRKLRGRATPRLNFEFVIGDEGIALYVPYLAGLKGGYSFERISTGVEKLDEMLGGGILRGSTILMSGPSGTGKTLLAVRFALKGIENGERVVFLSFEEPEDQLKTLFRSMKGDLKEMPENLSILSISPRLFTPGSLYYFFREVIEKREPNRIVIDGLTSLKKQFGSEFLDLAKMLSLLAKSKGITSLFTSLEDLTKGEEAGISMLADVLIALWYERVGDEFKRMIAVLKTRGSPHDRRWYELDFVDGEVVIK